jgi:cellobiose-specific phosphotransferase system component IIC
MLPRQPIAPLSARRPWMAALAESSSLVSSVKWGAIVGVVYYLISVLVVYLTNLALQPQSDVSKNPLPLLPLCLGIFSLVFALYVAGYLPAMERNHVAPGLVGAAVMLIVSRLLSQFFDPRVTTGAANNGGSLVVQILSLIITIAIYLLIGYLGAFYGVKRNTNAAKAKDSAPQS